MDKRIIQQRLHKYAQTRGYAGAICMSAYIEVYGIKPEQENARSFRVCLIKPKAAEVVKVELGSLKANFNSSSRLAHSDLPKIIDEIAAANHILYPLTKEDELIEKEAEFLSIPATKLEPIDKDKLIKMRERHSFPLPWVPHWPSQYGFVATTLRDLDEGKPANKYILVLDNEHCYEVSAEVATVEEFSNDELQDILAGKYSTDFDEIIEEPIKNNEPDRFRKVLDLNKVDENSKRWNNLFIQLQHAEKWSLLKLMGSTQDVVEKLYLTAKEELDRYKLEDSPHRAMQKVKDFLECTKLDATKIKLNKIPLVKHLCIKADSQMLCYVAQNLSKFIENESLITQLLPYPELLIKVIRTVSIKSDDSDRISALAYLTPNTKLSLLKYFIDKDNWSVVDAIIAARDNWLHKDTDLVKLLVDKQRFDKLNEYYQNKQITIEELQAYVDPDKNTLLHLTLKSYKTSSDQQQLATSLLSAESFNNEANNAGITPLHVIASLGLEDCYKEHHSILKPHLECKDVAQSTPLVYALRHGRLQMALRLIHDGASLAADQVAPIKQCISNQNLAKDIKEQLHRICDKFNLVTAEQQWLKVLDSGEAKESDLLNHLQSNPQLDVNQITADGKSALEFAVALQMKDLVALLMVRGLDLHRFAYLALSQPGVNPQMPIYTLVLRRLVEDGIHASALPHDSAAYRHAMSIYLDQIESIIKRMETENQVLRDELQRVNQEIKRSHAIYKTREQVLTQVVQKISPLALKSLPENQRAAVSAFISNALPALPAPSQHRPT